MDLKMKNDLIDEIRFSIPSKRMLEVTNNLAVRNPNNDELIYLKQRPNFEDTPLSEYIEYNEHHDMYYEYEELLTKSVIIDKSLLRPRGREALEKLK